jgi:hypothetical protein
MPTYKIPASWEVYGYCLVDAESIEEAIEIVEDDSYGLENFPDVGYVDGSFRVDRDIAYEDNDEKEGALIPKHYLTKRDDL